MQGEFVQLFTSNQSRDVRPLGYRVLANGCWIWDGRLSKGYGVVWLPMIRKTVKVHRLLYEQFVGPIPTGLMLDHFFCDTRACCNPAHVRPVTSRENTLRGDTLAARCLAKTHCVHGHPLVAGNLRRSRGEPHKRRCLTCKRIAAKRDYDAKKKWGP